MNSHIARDIDLLNRLAINDKQAIETIYKENFNLVNSFVLNNNGSGDDAKDIFQEGLLVLFEKSISGKFELTCQLKTYLFSVCRRLWLKKLEQQRRFGNKVENLEETIPVEEDLEYHEKQNNDFSLMEAAMAKIGEPCNSLLTAYYVQKKSMQDIAENFGYTNADNAKTQKYKCLMRLKKIFFTNYKNGQ